ncbi:hypothetical protein BJ138DRAFT_431147 [Hygrophoropsis aurantiaca]|uniref:Uncharacterized protein n=1 Tax=Hygrophoropsis aurantiaca TaxID=72124 RepID=A0ACB8A5C6_9AGAM|nr:hypothetical protein BJ138DRAFT_431147 [Hygrophoropsis aurantiaca]
MLQNLPPEILCKVISQLPIKSIVLLRQVSKHLRQVTYDRSIWVRAYRASPLVHPEGPFKCQTTQMLESILVRSARLAPNWPPNPTIKPVRTRMLPIQDDASLLCERWLLVTSDRKRIVCYDLDAAATGAGASMTTEGLPCTTLYGVPEENTSIASFLCDSILPSCTRDRCGAGRSHPRPLAFLTVILRKYRGHMDTEYMRKIYKINVAEDGLSMLALPRGLETNLPDLVTKMVVSPRLLAVYDPVKMPQEAILADVETHQLYELPESERQWMFYTIILTSTHVLLFCPYNNRLPTGGGVFAGTHIEAYEIPPRSTSELPHAQAESQSVPAKTQLRLSHVTTHIGALSFKDNIDTGDHFLPKLCPLRDATFNHATGVTSMSMVLACTLSGASIRVLHLQLHPALSPLSRATASAGDGIGTITLEPSKNIVDIGGYANQDMADYYLSLVRPAFNGHTRGMAFHFLREEDQGALSAVGMHAHALEIDDAEDAGCTRTSAEHGVWRFCGLQPESRIVASVPHRGRVVVRAQQQAAFAIHILDFV